jgi:hypothetical protein
MFELPELALLFLFLLELFDFLFVFVPPPVVAVELEVVVVPPVLALLEFLLQDFRNIAMEAARTRAKTFGIV